MTSSGVAEDKAPAIEEPRRSLRTPAGLAEALGTMRLSRFSGVGLWAVFVLIFAIWIPNTFLTATTAQTIANGQSITVILALGALVSLTAGQFDLSIANNLALGSVICVKLIVAGASTPEAALVTVLVCTSAGVVNAVLVVGIGIDSFIATLGSSSVFLAFAEICTGNNYVGPARASFTSLVSHKPLGIPILAVYAVGLAIVLWYALEHTSLGRRLAATGANPDAARLAGVRTRRLISIALIAGGFMVGVAAFLLASTLGDVNAQLGTPYLLPVFAACFLGTTQVKPGRFNVWGTLLALVLLATGIQGLLLTGAAAWVTDMFNGVALLTALGVAVTLQRRQKAKALRHAYDAA